MEGEIKMELIKQMVDEKYKTAELCMSKGDISGYFRNFYQAHHFVLAARGEQSDNSQVSILWKKYLNILAEIDRQIVMDRKVIMDFLGK